MKRFTALILLVLFIAVPVAGASQKGSGEKAASERVKHRLRYIGVLAKRGKRSAIAKWQPTADYLTASIPGHRFAILPLSFNEIFDAVRNNRVGFVLANPAIYLPLSMQGELWPLVTLENLRAGKGYPMFGGVIFVRADSPYRSYEDLQGVSFTAVSPKSLGGWLMAWRELRAHGVTPAGGVDKVFYAGTHDKVVYLVRDGRFQAGTVRTDTLERMTREGRISLADFRVITRESYQPTPAFPFLRSTPLYPEWPFAANKNTSEQLSKAVAIALLEMKPESTAARAASIKGWGVVRNYQPIHDLYRELHLGPYQKITYFSIRDVWDRYRLPIIVITLLFIFNLILITYLFHLKSLLRADIRRRQKMERILKKTNRKFYQQMKRQ
ncbi:MAG TPA: phosphate/phosphite/phosphonate ABC transporter substrate-binding protein [Desulfobulbus sp.]|nr:phosphate/phosphite/phosphonate ABC transporter substrate-binding protein [Desulfobulbus sp.]